MKKKRGRPPKTPPPTNNQILFNVEDKVLHIIRDDDDEDKIIAYFMSLVIGVYHTMGGSPVYDLRYEYKEEGDTEGGDYTIKKQVPGNDITKFVDLR